MNIQSYIHYTIFLIFILLAFITLSRNSRGKLHQIFAALMAALALWSLSFSFINNPLVSRETISIVVNIGSIANSSIGLLTLWAIVHFTGNDKRISGWLFPSLLALLLISITFFQLKGELAFTPGRDPQSKFWLIRYNNQLVSTIFAFLYYIPIILGLWLIYRFSKTTKDQLKKQQARIILLGGLISFLLALLNLYLPRLGILNITLMADIPLLILAGVLFYALKKLDLFSLVPSAITEKVIEMMPAGFIMSDRNMQIISVNSALLQLAGMKKKHILHTDIRDFLNQITGNETISKIFQYENFQQQLTLKSKKGEKKHILFSSKRIYDGTNVLGVLCVLKDITDLKESEEELKNLNATLERRIKERTEELYVAKEKAEESDRLKSAFLANMSHEIRTPLNGIVGFTGLLSANDITASQKNKYIDIIQNSTRHLLGIINDILDLSKIEVNQLEIERNEFNLNEVLFEQYTLFNKIISDTGKTNVSLHYKTIPEEIILYSDKNRFRQILNNLLNNALKHTEKGYIEFGYTRKQETLEFYVRDTGEGIDEKYHDIIFRNFRQAGDSEAAYTSGTGMGLSITKHLVELLGGEIYVESKKGKGSSFYFTLPYKVDKNLGPYESQHIKPQDDATVLIVEDDQMSREYLEEILKAESISYHTADNGNNAWEKIQKYHYKIILMDIQLPDMDGLQLTQKIRKENKDVIIIAQSAYAMDLNSRECLDAGCNNFLAKPLNYNEFLSTLKSYL